MRMLITGSRTWTDRSLIFRAMSWAGSREQQPTTITVVHGKCRKGADDIADDFARQLGWNIEAHPADWERYGKRAGFVRNAEMVAAGADVCLAFIHNNSKGATMCADQAEKAGILTHRFTS